MADISRRSGTRSIFLPSGQPRVSIIVAARNEEDHIAESLARLLQARLSNYQVIAVNDRSTDRTGARMDEIAGTPQAHGRLRVIHVAELPAGWLGKVHAMWTGANQATGEWLYSQTPMYSSGPTRSAVPWLTRRPSRRIILFFFRA